jgi:hypothetical protein
MCPPRDYISSTEQNQIKTRMRMERVLGSQGKSVRLKIDSELREIAQVVNKSNHPIQNPLLLVTTINT